MKLSIIIPCYNEANTIEKILEKIYDSYKESKEIIIIDDFSTDGTREILIKNSRSFKYNLILNNKNYGKGFCIKEGVIKASGEIIVIQDADLEYDPADYYNLINPIKNNFAEVVFGSRFQGSQERRVLYFWHCFGNYFLTLLSNMFTNINLTDMEVGLKAFKSTILKNIKLRENRFGFEPEITAKISKLNLRIFEVGISYHGRTYEQGKKINWKDGVSAIRCIFYYNLFVK
jgi:glycosyltransferase involved in cell wall biosynthesis